jgi:hypothetical protein
VLGGVSFTRAPQLFHTGVASLGEAVERQAVETVDLGVDVYRQSEKVPLRTGMRPEIDSSSNGRPELDVGDAEEDEREEGLPPAPAGAAVAGGLCRLDMPGDSGETA